MKISREGVRRVAELAHLALTDAELETYRAQLDSILTYVEKLNALSLDAVEPMAQALADSAQGEDPTLREDQVRPSDVGDAVLKRAAEARPPYFRVPKVIER